YHADAAKTRILLETPMLGHHYRIPIPHQHLDPNSDARLVLLNEMLLAKLSVALNGIGQRGSRTVIANLEVRRYALVRPFCDPRKANTSQLRHSLSGAISARHWYPTLLRDC